MESFIYEEKLKNIELVCQLYELGRKLYDSILESIKDISGIGVIVSPANLGDTVFIATLAKEYKKTHNISTLIIVAKKRQAEAAKLFEGVDETIGLDDNEMLGLRYYFTISRKFFENHIHYGHIPCDIRWEEPGMFYHIPPGFGGMPLMDVWTQRIFKLPQKPELSEIMLSDEDIPYENEQKFRNTVLIAPAAFTNKGIPESFWEKLVREIKNKGYEVYCNSGGLSYDKVIKGSTELVLGTKELVCNSLFFKHIIAVRSGFTDLVSKTNAPLTVLHLGGNKEMPLRVELGSRGDDVRDLGRQEDIFPVVYCVDREDELIRLILENIG